MREPLAYRQHRTARAVPVALAALALVLGCVGERPRPAPSGLPPVSVEWVRIPGGTFRMGAPTGEADERPGRMVTLRGFEMTRTEVTVAQYRACVDAGVCTVMAAGRRDCPWSQVGRDDSPMTCVTYDEARTFAAWAGGRLPSEAEWEYAARGGGRDVVYPWGDEPGGCRRAVVGHGRGGGGEFYAHDGCGLRRPWRVCSKPQGNTPQGLCDMSGNAWEWVADWYHPDLSGAPTDGSVYEAPPGPGDLVRVRRGGSWRASEDSLRATRRSYAVPGAASASQGFRVARDEASPRAREQAEGEGGAEER